MNCEACAKSPAVVHLTNVVNGKMERQRLCSACAAEKGHVVEPGEFVGNSGPLQSVVHQFVGKMMEAIQSGMEVSEVNVEEASKPCLVCEITPAEFHKRGRLGCPNDYVAFEEELARLLLKIHGKNVHVGRIPARAAERQGRRRFVRERVDALKKELDAAVRGERFEEAAKIRDRLRELEGAEAGAP